MKLENISNNTSGDKKSGNNKIQVMVIAVLCIVVVVFIVVYNGKKQEAKTRYESLVESYNAEVEEYNVIVKNINKLRKYLQENKVGILPTSEEEKAKLSVETEYTVLEDEIEKSKKDTEEILNIYNQACIENYNNAVENYNELVVRYNSLKAKIEGYGITDSLESVDEKETLVGSVDECMAKWDTVDEYIADLSELYGDVENADEMYYDACVIAYNNVVNDYNIMANAYNELLEITSVEFIDDMPTDVSLTDDDTDSVGNLEEQEFCERLEKIMDKTDELIGYYLIAQNITDPDTSWVKGKLSSVNGVTGVEKVTSSNNPDGLLGKEGAYKDCLYFTIDSIEASSVSGDSIVDKGTDAGGAVEIYDTLEYALNRCDYLAQFDGTILYSGSYVVVGTMVIRTSYKLSNQEQVELTDKIVKALTELE
jgi:hypothetical protein